MKSVWKIIIFLLLPSPTLRANAMQFTFDALFPSTPFKQVMMTCAQIRSSVSTLESYRDNDQDYETLGDLLVGRLTHLTIRVNDMLKDRRVMHNDDIEYLIAILEYMADEMKVAFQGNLAERGQSASALIEGMKSKLMLVIEG